MKIIVLFLLTSILLFGQCKEEGRIYVSTYNNKEYLTLEKPPNFENNVRILKAANNEKYKVEYTYYDNGTMWFDYEENWDVKYFSTYEAAWRGAEKCVKQQKEWWYKKYGGTFFKVIQRGICK